LSFSEKESLLVTINTEYAAQAPLRWLHDIRKLWQDWNQDFMMTSSIKEFLQEGVAEGIFRNDIEVLLLMDFMQVSV
jgi:hypothetical protein